MGQKIINSMGGLELLYDLSPDNSYKYIYEGQTHVSEELSQNTNKEFKLLLKNIPGSGVSNEWASINSTSKGTEHKYKFISN